MDKDNQNPEELGNVVSSLDMAAFLSEPVGSGDNNDIFEDSTKEPEVIVEGEKSQPRETIEVRGEADSSRETLQPDERLDSALRTIDHLRGEIESRQPQRQEFTTQNVEWMDTPWGIQIPKDPKMRFIQLDEKHLDAIGIDGSIAPGLNILANAFWASIVNTIPRNTMIAMEEIQNRRNIGRERYTSFFDEYSDLKDHAEFVQLIEHNARQSDRQLHGLNEADYRREISRRVRSKIAATRGISLDQYEREIGTSTTPRNRTLQRAPSVNRARSVGGGSSRANAPKGGNDIFSDTLYGG